MSGYAAVKRQAKADAVRSLASGVSPQFFRDLAAALDARGEIARADGINEALREQH